MEGSSFPASLRERCRRKPWRWVLGYLGDSVDWGIFFLKIAGGLWKGSVSLCGSSVRGLLSGNPEG